MSKIEDMAKRRKNKLNCSKNFDREKTISNAPFAVPVNEKKTPAKAQKKKKLS